MLRETERNTKMVMLGRLNHCCAVAWLNTGEPNPQNSAVHLHLKEKVDSSEGSNVHILDSVSDRWFEKRLYEAIGVYSKQARHAKSIIHHTHRLQ